jgi:hypothetical protein
MCALPDSSNELGLGCGKLEFGFGLGRWMEHNDAGHDAEHDADLPNPLVASRRSRVPDWPANRARALRIVPELDTRDVSRPCGLAYEVLPITDLLALTLLWTTLCRIRTSSHVIAANPRLYWFSIVEEVNASRDCSTTR